MVSAPLQRYVVAAEEAGARLDKFLVGRCPDLGRRGARSLIERALVRVGGAAAVKARRLNAGDVVDVLGHWGGPPEPEPDAPLRVLYERADLVVVDKPAGQPSAPLGEALPGTLAGALLGRYPEMAGVGYRAREPGLLHRLDTGTSGLVVAARAREAFEHLRAALERQQLHKRYLAVVEPRVPLPDAGVVELALQPDPSGSGRVRVACEPGTGRPCRSEFRTLERRGALALVEVVASRAYRHQVRVHLAASGWPIAGDRDYGGSGALAGRHALHASHVAWAGDEVVAAFAVDSPLPADLAAFLRGSSDPAMTSSNS